MSEQETNNLAEVKETEPKKEISKTIQYIIGAAGGVLTASAIVLSSADLGVQDQLLLKIQQYSFLIIFVAFMGILRRYERKHEIRLKAISLGYIIAMGVGVVVFLINAISKGALSFGG